RGCSVRLAGRPPRAAVPGGRDAGRCDSVTTAVAAAVWLIAGAAAGLAGPRLHVRRLAVGVPLAGLVAAGVAGPAGGTNALAGAGAAALLAAAVFQPLPRAAEGVEPVLVGILVAGGLAALLALLPLGGWATAGFDSLRGIDVAPWQLLVAPAVLLTAEALPPS